MSPGVPAAARAAACAMEDLPQVMADLLGELVGALPGARSAAVVTVAGAAPGAGGVGLWADAGQDDSPADAWQARVRTGPAVAAAATGEVVVVVDLGSDPRWAAPEAVDPSGPTSVVCIALPDHHRPVAVLSVLGTTDVATPVVVEKIAAALPELSGAVGVARARTEAQNLRAALLSSRTIGAAIGITMMTKKLDHAAAIGLLRTISNHTNTRLADLAESVLFTGEIPDSAPAPRRRGRPHAPSSAIPGPVRPRHLHGAPGV